MKVEIPIFGNASVYTLEVEGSGDRLFIMLTVIIISISLLQVVRKWRSLATRLGLSDYILDIDCYRGGPVSGLSRRRRTSREKDKMDLLLKIWRESRPESYNVGVLKTILSAEVREHSVRVCL